MKEFNILNDAKYEIKNDSIIIKAGAKTDYFVNPETLEIINNAPFIYNNLDGDFSIKALVSHDFISTYDACVLFAYNNERQWVKACFEKSDFNTNAVVSVVTDEHSDDANGVNISDKSIWLKLTRKSNVFAVHYSYDDITYFMVRLARVNMPNKIKVGLLAQSPTGNGTTCIFKNYSCKYITVKDIRSGV